MRTCEAGSDNRMDHQFMIPTRVVEITGAPDQEDDPDTDQLLPPAPAATDDGTPVTPPAERTAEVAR
jgi:hypothetical protein